MPTSSLRSTLNAELAAASALLHTSLPALAHLHSAYQRRHLDTALAVMLCLAQAGYTAEASPLLDLCRATRGDCELNSALIRCAHGERQRTRLMYAAHSCDSARLTFLLSCRGDLLPRSSPRQECVNQADASGRTALHYAASAGSELCAGLLLAVARISTGAVQEGGITPLHCACAAGSLRVVRALLAGGADANEVGAWEDEKQGWQPHCKSSPLGIVCVTGHAGVARALLQGGAKANQRVVGNLACSAGTCRHSEGGGDSTEERWMAFVMHMMVMRGGRGGYLDERDLPACDSPLYMAMRHKHEGVVRELLKGGAYFCNSAFAFSEGEMRVLLEHYKYKVRMGDEEGQEQEQEEEGEEEEGEEEGEEEEEEELGG